MLKYRPKLRKKRSSERKRLLKVYTHVGWGWWKTGSKGRYVSAIVPMDKLPVLIDLATKALKQKTILPLMVVPNYLSMPTAGARPPLQVSVPNFKRVRPKSEGPDRSVSPPPLMLAFMHRS